MQPNRWKDAGKALNNDELVGCHMPDGPGELVPNIPGYLQYNEVRFLIWLFAMHAGDLIQVPPLVHRLRHFPNPFEVLVDGRHALDGFLCCCDLFKPR